jgi:hypothetical protein
MKAPTAVALGLVIAALSLAAGGKTRPPVVIPERAAPERSLSAGMSAPCQEVWYRAVSGGASLPYYKASAYITNFKRADPDNDGIFTKSEFLHACQKGLVHLSAGFRHSEGTVAKAA